MSSRLLVTGATGMIGSLLTQALLDRGVQMSVMLRPHSGDRIAGTAGVTSILGDFDDPASLRKALEGVDRAFLLTNSSERVEAQQIAFVEAAQAQRVGHVVYLSQFAADLRSPDRFLRYHGAVEAALTNSTVGWTFVRPNLILQAYLPFAPVIARGELQAPIGDAAVSVVDARDIAAVAAAALTEDGHVGKAYTITGPAAVTHAEIAAEFGTAIGHPVRFESVSPEASSPRSRGPACPNGRPRASSRTMPTMTGARPAMSHPTSRRSPEVALVACTIRRRLRPRLRSVQLVREPLTQLRAGGYATFDRHTTGDGWRVTSGPPIAHRPATVRLLLRELVDPERKPPGRTELVLETAPASWERHVSGVS